MEIKWLKDEFIEIESREGVHWEHRNKGQIEEVQFIDEWSDETACTIMFQNETVAVCIDWKCFNIKVGNKESDMAELPDWLKEKEIYQIG